MKCIFEKFFIQTFNFTINNFRSFLHFTSCIAQLTRHAFRLNQWRTKINIKKFFSLQKKKTIANLQLWSEVMIIIRNRCLFRCFHALVYYYYYDPVLRMCQATCERHRHLQVCAVWKNAKVDLLQCYYLSTCTHKSLQVSVLLFFQILHFSNFYLFILIRKLFFKNTGESILPQKKKLFLWRKIIFIL